MDLLQLRELEQMLTGDGFSPGTPAPPLRETPPRPAPLAGGIPAGKLKPLPSQKDRMPGYDMMGVFRRHGQLLSFLLLLVFCSVMVVYQYRRNQSRHVEIREAFILLYTKGYHEKADRLYNHLVLDVSGLSIRTLEDDWQRTVLLVDPTVKQPDNLIWKYHWTVSNEMEKRSSSMLQRALQLAGEEK